MLVAFIRHGESELNRQGVLDGNSEAGLTEQGILQCMQLGQWIRHNLAEEAVIFSSPMRRARESAEYIRTAIAGKIYIDDRLGEAEFGHLQGKSVTDIDWDAEIGKSGVESAAHIRRRAYQFLEDQCKANQDKLVLVVTHGSFIRYLFSMIDSKFDLKCPVKNGSISLVEYQKPFGYRNAGFNITEFE